MALIALNALKTNPEAITGHYSEVYVPPPFRLPSVSESTADCGQVEGIFKTKQNKGLKIMYRRKAKKKLLIELEEQQEALIKKFRIKALKEDKSMKEKVLEFIGSYVKDC